MTNDKTKITKRMYSPKGHNLSSLKMTKTFHRRECLDQKRFHRCNRSCEPCPRCRGRRTGNLVGNNVRIWIRTIFITKYAGYDFQFVLYEGHPHHLDQDVWSVHGQTERIDPDIWTGTGRQKCSPSWLGRWWERCGLCTVDPSCLIFQPWLFMALPVMIICTPDWLLQAWIIPNAIISGLNLK